MTATQNRFETGSTVYGKVMGVFTVTGTRTVGGGTRVVDVREVRPDGSLGLEIGMTPDCFKPAGERGYTAVKPVWSRSKRAYEVHAVENANLHLVHAGFLVYDAGNEAATAGRVAGGTLMSHLKPAAKAALVRHLTAAV